MKVAALSELTDGGAARFDLGDGHVVSVVRIGSDVYAIGDTCSHANVSLSGGEVDELECTLECPKHGSEFDLRTGEALTLPATQPVLAYEVSVIDGDVHVEKP